MSTGLLGTIFQWLGYAVYNATPPVATSGSNVPLQSDVNGNLLVNVAGLGGGGSLSPSGTPITAASNGATLTPTGNLALWVDTTGGNVQRYLAPGLFDSQQILLVINRGANALTVNGAGGANNIKWQGSAPGSVARAAGQGAQIALTWCAQDGDVSGGAWIG
jgi:hypothetical protein